jgi:transposase, IS30 family
VTSQSQRSTMTYTHLTQDERYKIHALKHQNVSLGRIAAELQRNHSTISRELKRNIGPNGYKPVVAHQKARTRQTRRRNATEFTSSQWTLEAGKSDQHQP